MDVCCESLEAAGASMRPSGSSPAARPPLRHRRRPALAGEGPSLARPTPSLASPPLAGEAHALASEGPSPARVKALAGEAPRQRGPSPRWRGCPRQRGPRPRQRERVRFLMTHMLRYMYNGRSSAHNGRSSAVRALTHGAAEVLRLHARTRPRSRRALWSAPRPVEPLRMLPEAPVLMQRWC